jgi:hypothetical protein
MNFPVGDAGSQFFSVREASCDTYRKSAGGERQRNGENWPSPPTSNQTRESSAFGPRVAA